MSEQPDLVQPEPESDLLPDLPTCVALAGTIHRAEVGGNVCFHSVVSIAIISGGG